MHTTFFSKSHPSGITKENNQYITFIHQIHIKYYEILPITALSVPKLRQSIHEIICDSDCGWFL